MIKFCFKNLKPSNLSSYFQTKKNQITKENRELFDISNKFFKICELLGEYEVISLNDKTNKISTDLSYNKNDFACATTSVSDRN